MHSLGTPRQRYLDMIHRYLQGRLDSFTFRTRLPAQWAQERDELWHCVWQATHAQRCLEREQLVKGEVPIAEPSDPRRFPRMLDRLCTLCLKARKGEDFRASVSALFTAYRNPGVGGEEARYIQSPPRVSVFERPLPPGSRHRYPCTVEDIRAQLARVPEYDLEGLWAIGLAPRSCENRRAYAVYYRAYYRLYKPVILLHSVKKEWDFKMRARSNPGLIEQRYRVERNYGMEIDRRGSRVICRWPAENGRRFMAEHVLLHEIGHHVQYQQRWRAGLRRWLPSRVTEQFAEDYAIRFCRTQRE